MTYEELVSLENLFACWGEYKRGKSNKREIMEFERNLEDHIFSLHEELKTLTYSHGSYDKFHVFDPKRRLISKAPVRDRLVHHTVFQELYRIFVPSFIYHSYSSILGKGTHRAVDHLAESLRALSRNYTRTVYALKCDIKKFFQSIPHHRLFGLIARKIFDKKFLWLVDEIICSFPMPVDKLKQRERERVI